MTKRLTKHMTALDVRRLQRDGLLMPGRSFGWQWARNGKEKASIQVRTEVDRVILNYRSRSNGGDWKQEEYPVRLDWTGCNLGGKRAWFLCPARGCGKRVAILYGGSIFACRHCHKLAYECQRGSDGDSAMNRADTIRRRLGWRAGIAYPIGDKPKGMYWRTYSRLLTEYSKFASASWVGVAERLGLINRRLGGLGGNETKRTAVVAECDAAIETARANPAALGA